MPAYFGGHFALRNPAAGLDGFHIPDDLNQTHLDQVLGE